ncbi:neprilysin-1-like [Panulirus ornatus]|uniref:neprilysin-1-like n=1 Tax=Panulirus ornatus TaxID=150431 RepID=UPI003A85149D
MELGRSRDELVTPPGTEGGGARDAWRRRTPLEKVLLAFSGVSVLACMALVGVIAAGGGGGGGASSSSPFSISPPRAAAPQMERNEHNESPKASIPLSPPVHLEGDPSEVKEATPSLKKNKKSSRLPVYHARTDEGAEFDVCSTQECILAAAAIVEAMDTTIDPCQNFYQFACGGWMDKNPLPEESSRWSQFDILDRELRNALSKILTEPVSQQDAKPVRQSKEFYAACMNEDLLESIGVTPLVNLFEEFGGWPMTVADWNENDFDWQFSVAEARRRQGADYLVSVWVFADQKNTDVTAIYVDQTSLGMARSVLTAPHNYEERIAAYKAYMAATASIMATSLGQDTSHIEAEVADVFDFEVALANITTPPEDRRDIERMYNPMTVLELSDLTAGSDLNWKQMLSTMFQSAGIPIDGSTRVIVQETGYLKKLADLLAATSPRTVANYIMWRHVKALGDETNRAMRDASFQYAMVVSGVMAAQPRWEECADKANNYLGMALGTKYVETYFSQQAKDEASVMVEDIRSAFEDLLDVNDWMDSETKPRAMEKAEAINKFIAYPDWYGNASALETFFSGLENIENRTHFINTESLRAWWSTDELAAFGKPTRRDRWFSSPTIVNAFYMPEFNSITFPAGILQPPFYRANSLQALNYGGIGQVIGHEITHGFDDEGRQNDKHGNAVPWWSNATLDAFKGRAQCIVDQYDNIRLPELDEVLPNATLNGVNTQGENIADNGGLREAVLAYQKYIDRNGEEPRLPGLEEYTPMQLLFLSNANVWCTSITTASLLNQVLTDPHSPGKFRVIVPMSNMEHFSSLWNCPVGSGMNPADKCVVW